MTNQSPVIACEPLDDVIGRLRAQEIQEQLKRDSRRAKALGIPFNPKLPSNFDDCDNRFRPSSHQRWWNRPFIRTETGAGKQWLEAWPSGIRYDVRCLDGGAWDRSTGWGLFATFEQAIRFLQSREVTTP